MFWFGKSVQQVSVLPYAIHGDDLRFLLVTSRRRGRWILAKGWPEEGGSLGGMAEREGYEEAGVRGRVAARPIGHYHYVKRMRRGYRLPCTVAVYPMEVTDRELDWPERGERTCRWMSPAEAAAFVDEPGLRRLLRRLAIWEKGDKDALHALLKEPRPLPSEPAIARALDAIREFLSPSGQEAIGPGSR